MPKLSKILTTQKYIHFSASPERKWARFQKGYLELKMYFTKHVMAIHFAVSISFVNQYFLVSCRMDEVFIGTRVCVCIVTRSQDVDNDNQHRHYICDDGMLEQQCNKKILYAIASWIYFFTFFPDGWGLRLEGILCEICSNLPTKTPILLLCLWV